MHRSLLTQTRSQEAINAIRDGKDLPVQLDFPDSVDGGFPTGDA